MTETPSPQTASRKKHDMDTSSDISSKLGSHQTASLVEQKHKWFVAGDFYAGLSKDYESCERCGVIRQANGSTDEKKCHGVVRITTR